MDIRTYYEYERAATVAEITFSLMPHSGAIALRCRDKDARLAPGAATSSLSFLPSFPLPPYLGHVTYEETVLDPVGHGIFIQKQGGHGQRRGGPSRPQRRGRGEGGGEEGLGQGEEGEDEGGGRELHGWLAATLCCCR